MTNERGIRIHPEKGLNPHMGMCPRCGEENGEVILVGAEDGVYECRSCNLIHYGRPTGGKCAKCGERVGVRTRVLEDGEKIPTGLCDECKAKDEEVRKVVAEGGVYWKCAECHSQGALRGTSELAKAVRKTSKIPAPKPVGIEFTSKECPVCSANATK